MKEPDIPKRVVLVLLLLAMVVTFAGVITFLQVFYSAPVIEPTEPSSEGKVTLYLIPPKGEPMPQQMTDSTGMVAITLEPPVGQE